jgi:hypothetical protein
MLGLYARGAASDVGRTSHVIPLISTLAILVAFAAVELTSQDCLINSGVITSIR